MTEFAAVPQPDPSDGLDEPQEEPNCGSCHDSREIWYGPGSWAEPMKLPCPECCPSEELTF